MNNIPCVTSLSNFSRSVTSPRLVLTETQSPFENPLIFASLGCILTTGIGSCASKLEDRRVIAPVCQCSRTLPVVNTNGYSSSGNSSGGSKSVGTIVALPVVVGNPEKKIISSPGKSVAKLG